MRCRYCHVATRVAKTGSRPIWGINMKVTGLHTYPVKSLGGLQHASVQVEMCGLGCDRRYMLVDEDNAFLTQRELPVLATYRVELRDEGFVIHLPGGGEVRLRAPDDSVPRTHVVVWSDVVSAATVDEEINAELSASLGRRVRLVYMDDSARRVADKAFAPDHTPVSFADGYPVLLTSEASLSALNRQIEKNGSRPVPMDRFRANIIMDGAEAFDEDAYLTMKIGDLIFDVVKPCTRCVVPTRDQQTGIGAQDNEPIRALTQIRRSDEKNVPGVLFGVNLVPKTAGHLSLGDPIEIIARRATPWAVRS